MPLAKVFAGRAREVLGLAGALGVGPRGPRKATSGLLVMPTVSSQCLLLPEQWPTSLWPLDNELFEVQMSPSIFRPLQPLGWEISSSTEVKCFVHDL